MARYGTFKWDDGTKWDATPSPLPGDATMVILVDWNNDGTLEDVGDSDYAASVNIRRGKDREFSSGGSGFEHCSPSKASISLHNHDRRYDPRNASSPLYPNIKPGRRIQIIAHVNSSGANHILFTGVIDDLRGFSGNAETAEMECYGYTQQLNDQKLTLSSDMINTTISAAMTRMLTDSAYPGLMSIDTDSQPVRVFAISSGNAGGVLHSLADSAMGTFFEARDGRAMFYRRSHTGQASHTIGQADTLREVETRAPWADVYNDVTVTATVYVKQQPSTVWFQPDPILLGNGETTTLKCDYQIASDLGVDTVEGNEAADESGAAVEMTLVSSDLGFTSGTIVIGNYSGGSGYLTKCEVRGRQWDTVDTSTNVSDATSQGVYKTRRFDFAPDFLQDKNYAASFASTILAFAKDDRGPVTIQILNRPTVQYPPELLDDVVLTAAALDIDDTYRVVGIEHDWRPGAHLTRLMLDKVIYDTTSITPAVSEDAPITEAPLGYKNPAGDPQTQEDQVNKPFVTPVILDIFGTATFATPDQDVEFDTKIFDPNNMIEVPDTEVKISSAGWYALWCTGHINCLSSSSADQGKGLIGRWNPMKNGIAINANTPSAIIPMAAIGGGYYQARATPVTALVVEFAANDILTVNASGYLTSSSAPCSYQMFLTLFKVKDITA